jgi:RimJ/RimL family protein N-acetyltransferase
VTFVATERLTLTTLTRDEADALRVGERTGRAWAPDYPTDGDLLVAAVVGEAGDAYDEAAVLGPLQIRRAATGEAIGGIGFLSAPDADGAAEVGYGLAESARGQGLATEALAAVLALARSCGVRVVVAMTAPDNAPSHRVLQRTGFVRAGESESAEDGVLWRWEHSLER